MGSGGSVSIVLAFRYNYMTTEKNKNKQCGKDKSEQRENHGLYFKNFIQKGVRR